MRPPHTENSPRSSGPKSPRSSQSKSPRSSQSKSPRSSQSKSPRSSKSKSPRSSESKSPRLSGPKSPRSSGPKSPRSSGPKSNRSSGPKSPRSSKPKTKKSKKRKNSKEKSSSFTSLFSQSVKSLQSLDPENSQQSLPFTPTTDDPNILGTDIAKETAPGPEDYFNDFNHNFDVPPPPPLCDDYIDINAPPPAPFPFGDNDTFPDPKVVTIIDPSQLPCISPNCIPGVECGGMPCLCSWWKARSILCCKCYETPLCPRPKPQTGGYGIINNLIPKRLYTRAGINGEGDHQNIGKLVPGLCSECAAKEAEDSCEEMCWGGDFSFRTETGNGKGRQFAGSSFKRNATSRIGQQDKEDLCNCTTTTTYKAAYTNPENQYYIKQRHKKNRKAKKGVSYQEQMERNQVYLEKFRELMKRPPWNFDTRVPTPPFSETLGGVETQLQNLDEMINEDGTPRRARSRRHWKPQRSKSRRNLRSKRSQSRRKLKPQRSQSRRNWKPQRSRSRPRGNVSKSRSRVRGNKRPTRSPSRATRSPQKKVQTKRAPPKHPRRHMATSTTPTTTTTGDVDSGSEDEDFSDGSGSGSDT